MIVNNYINYIQKTTIDGKLEGKHECGRLSVKNDKEQINHHLFFIMYLYGVGYLSD